MQLNQNIRKITTLLNYKHSSLNTQTNKPKPQTIQANQTIKNKITSKRVQSNNKQQTNLPQTNQQQSNRTIQT